MANMTWKRFTLEMQREIVDKLKQAEIYSEKEEDMPKVEMFSGMDREVMIRQEIERRRRNNRNGPEKKYYQGDPYADDPYSDTVKKNMREGGLIERSHRPDGLVRRHKLLLLVGA